MGIQDITKFQFTQMTKAKTTFTRLYGTYAYRECLLDYVMPQLLFKDA
jgi:hypothetical protein